MARSRNHFCNGNATMRCVYPATCHCQHHKNTECCTTMLLRQIYVAGNNKTYLGLHVKCPILLSDFNQIWSFSTDFRKGPRNQSARTSVQWEPR
jgi:hypothetical protein